MANRDVDEVGEREQFIVFLRHGDAEPAAAGQTDEQRSLSAEGHAEMKVIARGLERALPKVEAIFSSPLLRAQQTALWVSKAYRSRTHVATSDALGPDASIAAFRDFLASIEERRVVLVGHEPTLGRNLRALIGAGGAANVQLKTGACYGVRMLSGGAAVLEWLLSPRILRKLGEEA
jgi:phosphohistidine phosphatase